MAGHAAFVPTPTPEHRRIAVGQFERANQVIATGNYDYAIQLLLTCCKMDPANLIYRQTLRRTEKIKYRNNLRGSRLAFLTTSTSRTKLKAAKASRDYLKVLECGEKVLLRNPWDIGAQMDMAEAADALGLLDVAVWTLEQARQKNPEDATVNRALARLYEKRGNFSQAIALWELIRKAEPRDVEAQHKAKDLAASDTIARGNYEAVFSNLEEDYEGDEQAATTGESAKESAPVHQVPVQESVSPEPRDAAALRARIKADPTNVNAHLHLASVFRRAGQIELAREVLQQALGPTANAFELTLEIADLDIEPFRRNLVITDEKLRTQPQDEELRKIRIRLLKEINTREMDLFRQKAERFPTEMAHRLELGVRLLRAGQTDGAIVELQAARTDPRQRWRALLYLGYCFKNRNNWRLAQRNFEEALQTLPIGEDASRKELLFQLAQGAADSGDLSKAIDLAYELANLDFSYRDIGRLLDEWQDKLQKA
ncbi:MAG TPA: tetratricopeptide repeat protein [Gemmataceae bacterium]|nr:tetratricopeptide repeat protein [Gemmataceae bacterium]